MFSKFFRLVEEEGRRVKLIIDCCQLQVSIDEFLGLNFQLGSRHVRGKELLRSYFVQMTRTRTRTNSHPFDLGSPQSSRDIFPILSHGIIQFGTTMN